MKWWLRLYNAGGKSTFLKLIYRKYRCGYWEA